MTNTQLQQRAIAVMNRLNKLGFTKNGKPMVIDQAYELVAAEENLKNQHVLRSQLEAEVPLALIPDHPEQCDGQDFIMREDVSSVWLSVGQFSVNVLRGTQPGPEKDAGLRVMVYPLGDSEECLEQLTVCPEDFEVDPAAQADTWSADIITQLIAVGYELQYSEYRKPYWVFNDEGSEDFETEEQAWKDAWRHSKGKFIKLESNENIPHVSNEDWSSSENPEVKEQAPQTEMQAAIQHLVATWADGNLWGEHPYYTRGDWQYEVSNDDTTLGYWEWVVHQIDGNGGEDEHCACGAPLNDGEGWDGKCGDCADKAEKPTIDRSTHTTYSFSIGALTRGHLEDECADQAVPAAFYTTEPADELRTVLLSRYDNAVRTAAEEALDTSVDSLPKTLVVAARSGWETSEVGHSMVMRRAIFLENQDTPDLPTAKRYFTVEIVNCVAVNSSWSD